jgi:hypothetical protein
MAVTADQHSQIAKVYEKAAADHMVPQQQREAFARKASWFHMLAGIAAKKEAATGAAPSCSIGDNRSKAR